MDPTSTTPCANNPPPPISPPLPLGTLSGRYIAVIFDKTHTRPITGGSMQNTLNDLKNTLRRRGFGVLPSGDDNPQKQLSDLKAKVFTHIDSKMSFDDGSRKGILKRFFYNIFVAPFVKFRVEKKFKEVEDLINKALQKTDASNFIEALYPDEEMKQLFEATENGNIEKAKTLVARGVPIDVTLINISAWQPLNNALGLAIRKQDSEMVTALLQAAKESNPSFSLSTEMKKALITYNSRFPFASETTIRKSLEAIPVTPDLPIKAAPTLPRALSNPILPEGTLPNLTEFDQEGYTPLTRAVNEGNADRIYQLGAAGAELNASGAQGWTPLTLAVFYNNTDLIWKLHAAGAKLDTQDRSGLTPLAFAQQRLAEEQNPQERENIERTIRVLTDLLSQLPPEAGA